MQARIFLADSPDGSNPFFVHDLILVGKRALFGNRTTRRVP
jgi:hypothetical protein